MDRKMLASLYLSAVVTNLRGFCGVSLRRVFLEKALGSIEFAQIVLDLLTLHTGRRRHPLHSTEKCLLALGGYLSVGQHWLARGSRAKLDALCFPVADRGLSIHAEGERHDAAEFG